ncbi:HAMP domain-containing sensor histidine kinase [Breoghania sp. L-A4]|uniref:sensor histidine kinase n=1 Tax=Breoghania sp. L-A4 TaxID=2304600 RepID=UPI000E3587A2|nr:HAMP domain-containing sensor histidine kinase [Breoghania sp. L-A4]AXS41780.1 sensor histidine kinase [Breoghania sp. L-A4]
MRLTRDLADPRFAQPLSGLYWMISVHQRGQVLRSRSLWDDTLDLPSDDLEPGAVHRHRLDGPGGTPLIVREQRVQHPSPQGARSLRVAVAIEAAEIEDARRDYALAILPSLGLLAAALIAAAVAQAFVGLRPLRRLERDVAAVRSGATRQLPVDHPDEVMPLVTAVNDLLQEQEKAIDHARARAADLAHGLKTPLTVLRALGQRLRRGGEEGAADDIEAIGADMRRQVEHQLVLTRIRTRSDGRAGEPCPLGETIDRLVRTLRQTPAGEAVVWQVDVPATASFRIDRSDLTEMLGNLLENAVKWTTSRIAVRVREEGRATVLEITDDGPGMPPEQAEQAFRRGVRLDERRPGHGLGLSIVSEICAANGIDVTTAPAEGGRGLLVRLTQVA